MLFNSLEYLIFLPIVFIIYWFVLNKNLRLQNILLLLSSYVFYGWWDWRFLGLIIFSSFLDYLAGIKIASATTKSSSKRWLYVSLISNLGLLGVFKYFNFFADTFAITMSEIGWQVNDLTLNIILPVGISFFTFQTLSYSIDIYRSNLKPTKDIISFFTFVSFFPQLVAGPIERASNLLPQIESKRIFNSKQFNQGVLQIFIGLFRKIVIADNLAIYVDTVYGNSELYNSNTLILATILYSFQIYYDFAGYSDIAIGSAKLFGFNFAPNFNFPYFSKSITEFWRRWHMSLSFWLRDYLYISLGGNRKGFKITYRNLLLTMLLGGLWHGSSWNFVIWGAIHGLFLSFEKFTFSYFKIKNFNFLGVIYTYIIVIFAWIFFRARDLTQAIEIITEIFSFSLEAPFLGDVSYLVTAISMLILGLIFDFVIFKRAQKVENLGGDFSNLKFTVSVSLLILLVTLFYSTSNNFIYFQF